MYSTYFLAALALCVLSSMVMAQPNDQSSVDQSGVNMMTRCRTDKNCPAPQQCQNRVCVARKCNQDNQCLRLGRFYCAAPTKTCVPQKRNNKSFLNFIFNLN